MWFSIDAVRKLTASYVVVTPTHRRINARKVRQATRHLGERMDAWQRGRISFAELDASVKGWVNHVRYADTWGLRRFVFYQLAGRNSIRK